MFAQQLVDVIPTMTTTAPTAARFIHAADNYTWALWWELNVISINPSGFHQDIPQGSEPFPEIDSNEDAIYLCIPFQVACMWL